MQNYKHKLKEFMFTCNDLKITSGEILISFPPASINLFITFGFEV